MLLFSFNLPLPFFQLLLNPPPPFFEIAFLDISNVDPLWNRPLCLFLFFFWLLFPSPSKISVDPPEGLDFSMRFGLFLLF